MAIKSTDPSSTPITEEVKEHNSRYSLSKYDFDLYHEADDVANPVIRMKRTALPNNGERWKLYQDNAVMLVLEGTKLNNKEKDFLRTAEGVNFVMAQYKAGIGSFSAMKKEIKKELKG